MDEKLKNLLMGLTLLHIRVNSLANDLAKVVEGIESGNEQDKARIAEIPYIIGAQDFGKALFKCMDDPAEGVKYFENTLSDLRFSIEVAKLGIDRKEFSHEAEEA